jgi:8-oxo-dGTP pyrophosphatase MutT (NUDIX family)
LDGIKPLKACGVIVFRHVPDHSFLLMAHADRWDLPKGKLDHGEDEASCALRELEEETGITRRQIRLDPDFRFVNQYPIRHQGDPEAFTLKELVVFLGTLIEPVEIRLTEHVGYRWVPWQPPHHIQKRTIDPLLESLHRFWSERGEPAAPPPRS